MIVDFGVFGELGSQVRRKNICKVRILGGNLYRSLFGNQAGYLRPLGRVNIEGRDRSLLGNQTGYLRSPERVDIKRCNEQGGTEGRNMNYISPIFRIECCSGELLFTH